MPNPMDIKIEIKYILIGISSKEEYGEVFQWTIYIVDIALFQTKSTIIKIKQSLLHTIREKASSMMLSSGFL